MSDVERSHIHTKELLRVTHAQSEMGPFPLGYVKCVCIFEGHLPDPRTKSNHLSNPSIKSFQLFFSQNLVSLHDANFHTDILCLLNIIVRLIIFLFQEYLELDVRYL